MERKPIPRLSGGASDNVRRQTDQRKRITIYARVSLDDYEKIQRLKSIRGTENESQIIREAIRTYYGLLSGAQSITPAANIVIQNPIVNMNVVEAKAEARPQVNVNIDVKALEDVVRLLEYLFQEASRNMPPANRRVLEKRVRRAERVLEELMVKLN